MSSFFWNDQEEETGVYFGRCMIGGGEKKANKGFSQNGREGGLKWRSRISEHKLSEVGTKMLCAAFVVGKNSGRGRKKRFAQGGGERLSKRLSANAASRGSKGKTQIDWAA